LVVRWGAYQPLELSDPVVDAAWQKLEGNWHEPQAHARFLEAAAAADSLTVAAARYRQIRDLRPDDARATEGLRRAAQMAATLYQMRRGPLIPKNYFFFRVIGWLSAGLVVLALLWAVHFLFSRTA
jgi:hypothetical protein